MKNFLILTVIILFACFMQSCYNSTGNKPVGLQINGKVIDSDKNTGVEGVIITTEPATTMNLTDANGNFSINVDQSGTYTVYAKKTGYSNGSQSVKVADNLTPNATIYVRDVKSINKPPNKPVYTNPEDGDSTEFKSVTLKWEGSDPDGNSLKYDVYFGATNPPTIAVARDVAVTSYTIDSLQENTTYYWKIVAKDDYESTDGDIWSFRIYKPEINEKGLVAYYPFNNNTNDESGNNLDGKPNNIVFDYDRKGNANSSCYFNGNGSYVQLPFSNKFDLTEDFTLSVWIKPDLYMCRPYDTHIDIISHLGDNFVDLAMTTSLGFEYWIRTGYNNEYLISNSNILKNKEWNHLAVVFKRNSNQENGMVNIYANGKNYGSKLISHNPIVNNTPFYIGYRSDGQSRFAGSIDEVYFYNRALSDAEIQMLSNK